MVEETFQLITWGFFITLRSQHNNTKYLNSIYHVPDFILIALHVNFFSNVLTLKIL